MAFPSEVYPNDPDFPSPAGTVQMDQDMYTVITDYITKLAAEMKAIGNTNGDIDLAINRGIAWGGTFKIILYSGDTEVIGDLRVTGTLTKGAGSFKITHPLDDTKYLLHGFIEGPEYGLLYRGKVQLKHGYAIVNIDESCGMTRGTFDSLARNPTVYLQNLTGFAAVRPGPFAENKFEILAADKKCDDTISWLVCAERKDEFVLMDKSTDDKGHLILEIDKEGEK